jgi:hypothetical protein
MIGRENFSSETRRAGNYSRPGAHVFSAIAFAPQLM